MSTSPAQTLLAGRYRVRKRLGSGGMAVVYLAEDERLGREVAVKLLHAESPEETARRFEREAKLGASLNHPNLVGVYDIVTTAEDVLIVMEYVEGPTLARLLAHGPVPRTRALEVLRGVAAALDHAHDQGVVHRDVKPANVLGADGVARLADLGIATAAEGTSLTRSGTVMGTPSYMAPEQLSDGALGPAIDVYALASVAFETLAGRKAQMGSTPLAIAHKVASGPPPDLREAWPDAPSAAAEVLKRGMARQPDERPASAGALVAELSEAMGLGQRAVTPPSDPTKRLPPERTGASDGDGDGDAAVAAGGGAVAGASARSNGAGAASRRRPGGARRRPARSRWARPLALAAGMLFLALAALVYFASGGDDEPQRSVERAPERPAQGAAPGTPMGPAERKPEDTVVALYQRGAADDFDGAWKLAGEGLDQQFGGQEGFANTLSTLSRVAFSRAETIRRTRDSATVAFTDTATHPDFVDRCTGTATLSRDPERGWLVERLTPSCTRVSGGGGSTTAAGDGG